MGLCSAGRISAAAAVGAGAGAVLLWVLALPLGYSMSCRSYFGRLKTSDMSDIQKDWCVGAGGGGGGEGGPVLDIA